MPNSLAKNLNLCFKNIRFPLASHSSSSHLLSPDDDGRRLLTSSSTATTNASPTIFRNYNSLYDNTFDYSTHSSSLSFNPEHESDSEPDFATVFASQRFFFTSPGSSNSIIESTPSPSIAITPESSDTAVLANSSSPTDNANESSYEHSALTTVKNSVAVPTVSPNPYMDFRRSMQEMLEARNLIDVKANWEYLHELLLCYLALNPKSTHKFIVGAFADLVSLMTSEGGNDGKVDEITSGPGVQVKFCTTN